MMGFVSWLIEAHVLVIALALAHRLLTRTWLEPILSPRLQLLLGRTMLVAALVAPGVARLMPRHQEFPAVEDVLAKRASRVDAARATIAAAPQAAPAGTPDDVHSLDWTLVLAGVALFGVVARRAQLLSRDLWRLSRIVRSALPLRRVGKIDVRLSDKIVVPMSTRLPWRAYVLMPAIMLADRRAFDIALRHEGQHHRQGDTAFAYVIELVRLVLAGNPLVGRWTAQLTELQELACDAAVVGGWGNRTPRSDSHGISAHAYGSCLLWVTEAAGLVRHAESALAGTASMTHGSSDPKRATTFLERRIRMLSRYRSESRGQKRTGKALTLLVGLTALALAQAAAYAARGSAARTPLTMAEATKLAQAASTDDFTVVMNDAVLARLNLIITDPGRAKFHRESIARMAEFKDDIGGEIEKFGHPKQLLAVPLVESGYRNLPEKEHKLPRETIQSAGLWQFIRQTARNFGLRVNAKVDDRTDVKLATNAAMRYLAKNQQEFKHWHLTLASYNQGEGFVRDAIEMGETRDAFKLIEQKRLNDYLVMMMAAAIVIENPTLVE